MTICVSNNPQCSCEYFDEQQIITCVNYMTVVDCYLYVLPCNYSNITGNYPILT